jgi:hypothetical protein
VIVKPWCARLTQRTALAPIVHVTAIGPIPPHLRPLPSATGRVPTKESWLSRASDGRPVEPRNTKPGSPKPTPAFGAGTDLALQSSCIGGELTGWIATPHATFPPNAVHSCAVDAVVEASAGADETAGRLQIQTRVENSSRRTPTSSHFPDAHSRR